MVDGVMRMGPRRRGVGYRGSGERSEGDLSGGKTPRVQAVTLLGSGRCLDSLNPSEGGRGTAGSGGSDISQDGSAVEVTRSE